jgi:hypothetical protein
MTTQNQTLEYVDSKLNERRTELKDFLANGSLKDFNEYQKLCGVIQGLDYAKQIISDLANRLENNEDD